MFTGIIEQLGTVKKIVTEGTNVHFTIEADLAQEVQIDQSVAHNGVCLTVVEIEGNKYVVTAIEETLQRSNIGHLQEGSRVNLERAMMANARLDGHIVQGHVDATATCVAVKEVDGSWYYQFQYTPTREHIVVDKGSICINGVSLTVVDPVEDKFSVAIIPYTHAHTNFQDLKAGDTVNLEFDIIGKYIAQYMAVYAK